MPNSLKHYLVLLVGVLCIAWSAIFVKLADVSGPTSAFYRMLIASVGAFPLWWRWGSPVSNWKSIRVALLCGFFFACDIALWNTSILLSKASVATVLGNLAPVWVGLASLFFFKFKPGWVFWVGTLVSLAGVVIIVGLGTLVQSELGTGHYLAVGASIFYGAYLLATSVGRSHLDTITFTFVSMLSSTLFLFLFCMATGVQMRGFSATSWLALGGMGIVSQLFGWLAINYTLRYIKPTVASVSLLAQSVFTAIFAMPVLGEYLTPLELSGGILVLAGIGLVNRERLREKKV
jgi:drug/metabolite transporter (DMT)-like permease